MIEIKHQLTAGQEAQAVAFHPSGFHIVLATGEKVMLMNVLSNCIKEYPPTIPIKAVNEIRFSPGGHIFACAN